VRPTKAGGWAVWVAALLATLVVCIAAPALANKTPEELFQAGNEQFNTDKIDEAIALYEQAVAAKPDLKEAWYNLGIARSKKGDFAKELEAYEKALALDPKYAKALYNKAISLEDNGRTNDAISTYDEVLALEPNATDALINKGILLVRQSREDEALALYDQALKVEPESADAYFNKGLAFHRKAGSAASEDDKKRLYGEEIAAYRKATELRSNYYKAWYNLGFAYGELDQLDNEIEAYQNAIKHRQDYPQAHFNLARAYQEKGDREKAIAGWRAYLEVAEPLADTQEAEFVKKAKEELARLEAAGAGAAPAPAPSAGP
jgi:tetratricopeptide (TPR) repeat protein